MICDEMDDMLDNHLLSYNQNSNKQNQLCGVISLKRAKKCISLSATIEKYHENVLRHLLNVDDIRVFQSAAQINGKFG